ncbi:MAG TPA: RNA polymerase sigma factor [Acidimicrobiales bacterium]|nr:RNA polymerase sigma factor [Acidimicrobiales bacterium]
MTALPAPLSEHGPGERLRGAELDALAARAREGDRDAFEHLVVATTASCYQLAYRLVGNEHDARDVVQETYLRAYRGLKRFRGEAAVTTWLHRITVNTAARLLERRSRSATATLDENVEVVEMRPDRLPESAASAADDRSRLVAALGELPDGLRLVVVLRDVYDLPHRDIARELGISQSAAKVRLHRARRLLRERIFPARRAQEQAVAGDPADEAV